MKSILAVLGVLFILNTDAEARRGFAIIGWGDQISHVADLPDAEYDADLGYKYGSFRLFWIPLITWGSEHVYYRDLEYGDIPPDELEEIKQMTGSLTFKGNLWVKYVNYFWIALIVGFILIKVLGGRKKGQGMDEQFDREQV